MNMMIVCLDVFLHRLRLEVTKGPNLLGRKNNYVLVSNVVNFAVRKVKVMQGRSPALPASGCHRSKKKSRKTRI